MTGRFVHIDKRAGSLLPGAIEVITAAASKRKAVAVPAFEADGRISEMHVFRGGALKASIFKPNAGSGYGVWLADEERSVIEPDAEDAVCRGLQAPKQTPRKSGTFRGANFGNPVAVAAEAPAAPQVAA